MELIVILVLILLNGLFAMSEIALISARRSKLEIQARQGNAGARRAQRLIENPDRFLSTIQIGITLIGILTGIYSGDALAERFGHELASLGIPPRVAAAAAQVIIVIVVTYLTLIFGELVPKRIGMNAAEKTACAVSRPMHLLSLVASPFVWLLAKSTAGITRLLGIEKAESHITEEEIRSIIREGAEEGEVQEVEQKIVGRVFSLGDRRVESIMTPRSELTWLEVGMTTDEIRAVVNEHPHNRYPVGRGSLDDLVGVVYLKELFQHLHEPGFSLERHLEPVKFFHEGLEVYGALEQLRHEQCGYGVVFDEFGLTRGIITLKDIFEALVGEIPDGEEEPDIVEREDGSCLIDGQCPFFDLLTHFGMDGTPLDNAYNTVSGLFLDLTGHIPQTGEHLDWKGLRLEIVDMDGVRIDKILVKRITTPEA
ncbi:hemolysin family protein [uncultured Alistipes sp.]|mgnify:FL=1|uniref:hemolysin family protein n=1 Tax=uncultured Alistipes sp. TaxID=538949 RepID=UPI0028046F5F|nr:hemolysin family protein [uncultured Alistipes sp.]